MMTKEKLADHLSSMNFVPDLIFESSGSIAVYRDTFKELLESHLACLAEVEIYKAESVLKNGLINQYKDDVEDFTMALKTANQEIEKLKGIINAFIKSCEGMGFTETAMIYKSALAELEE